MGKYVTSLLLSRSGDCAIRLAVMGASAGMSTRAPLPSTDLMSKNASFGTGVITAVVRSEAWIWVRAAMAFFATTTFVPIAADEKRKGRLATPAAVTNAST